MGNVNPEAQRDMDRFVEKTRGSNTIVTRGSRKVQTKEIIKADTADAASCVKRTRDSFSSVVDWTSDYSSDGEDEFGLDADEMPDALTLSSDSD